MGSDEGGDILWAKFQHLGWIWEWERRQREREIDRCGECIFGVQFGVFANQIRGRRVRFNRGCINI